MTTSVYKESAGSEILPEGWKVKTLGQVAVIKHGRDQKSVQTQNGIYPILASGGEIGRTNTPLYNKPSVLIGRKGTIDKPRFIDTPFWTVDTLFYTEITSGISPKWLFYVFQTINWRLYNEASGVPSLSSSTISSIKLKVPQLYEQNLIAQALDTVEGVITITNRLISQKERLKKWLMQELLNGKTRIKGFEKGELRIKTLNDCLTYTPREVPKPNTSFFALGIRSHGKGIFHKNDFEPEDLAMDVLYEVKEKDLIVNITFAWEHAIAIASKRDDGGLVSHRFPTYVFNTENAIPEFFQYLILQKRFKYQLDLISPGGAGRNRVMSKKDFLKIEVQIPNIEEQKAIADILDCASKEIQLLKAKADKLKEQKKGMMQLLLTGKKRLKIDQ